MSQTEPSRIANFYPAVVRTTPRTGLYIEYYIYDPSTDGMVRKFVQIKRLLKRLRSQRERNVEAQRICDEINAKLRGGWSPLHQNEDARIYTPLITLKEKYLTAKRSEGCRESTLTQYGSVLELWLRWCEDNGLASLYSSTYLRTHAVRYLDDVLERGNRHRSYNNTVKVMKAFWQWALEHCYAKENPFLGQKTLKKEQKIRILVPQEARKKVYDWYATTRPAMNIVCHLVYSALIRPAEIRFIQLKHIHLDQHYITIPADNAKNHHERPAALTPQLVELLTPILQKNQNPDLFLFGKNEQLAPGKEPVNKDYFQKSWDRMRQATGIPKEMQLYSLRDTGLTDLIDAGLDPLTVRQHADHSSLAMTDIYTSHFDPTVNNAIYTHAPKF
jgi:site-specific recombinase XerD